MRASFYRPTSGVIVRKLSRYVASIKRVLVYISTYVNIKKRNHNGGHDDFLLNCNIGYKKHTADLAL